MNHWTPGKQTRVLILLGLIITLFASFTTFEWTQVHFGLARVSDPELLYSRFTKTGASLLVFVLALSIGRDGVDGEDTWGLRRAFLFIFAGDLCFLLNELHPAMDYPAILSFLIGHLLIIGRNARGWRQRWRAGQGRQTDILTALVIVTLAAALFVFTLLDHLQGSPLLYVLLVYAVVLDASLWAGWSALRTNAFPRANAWLIAIGASLFFVGDYLVGFNLSLEPSMERVTTLFLTWLFYAPAITLFALSGYRWGRAGSSSAGGQTATDQKGPVRS